jgi:HPr kinase/phosphorylase
MDTVTTVGTLLTRYQQRLGLSWLAGQAGAQAVLSATGGGKGVCLLGHLSIIHPNRLQVLGQVEIDYLDSLGAAARAELLAALFGARPAAVILAEGLTAPADLLRAAEDAGIALLGSTLQSEKLIRVLNHYLTGELAEKTTIHGVFLEVVGLGVLITGDSGVGKSELALELITRNHRLIADDAPEFSVVGPDTLRGTCPEMLRDFLEVRGLGLLNIRAMYGDSAIKMSKDLRLIVHLQRMKPGDMHQVDRLKGSYRKRAILDIEVPEVILPVLSGRNLAVLVEAAARDNILLHKGYNAYEAFLARQHKLLSQQGPTS